MRRAIQVYGCTMNTGETITTDDSEVVAIKVHPDKSVEINKSDQWTKVPGFWISYTARTL